MKIGKTEVAQVCTACYRAYHEKEPSFAGSRNFTDEHKCVLCGHLTSLDYRIAADSVPTWREAIARRGLVKFDFDRIGGAGA